MQCNVTHLNVLSAVYQQAQNYRKLSFIALRCALLLVKPINFPEFLFFLAWTGSNERFAQCLTHRRRGLLNLLASIVQLRKCSLNVH